MGHLLLLLERLFAKLPLMSGNTWIPRHPRIVAFVRSIAAR
jgi:hypothetical protein